jgi:hypothetical protein
MGALAMTIWSDMLDGIYDTDIAVDASLTGGSGGDAVSVRIVDKTDGLDLVDGEGIVRSIQAAAYIRMSELSDNSISIDDLAGGTLVIGTKSWVIKSYRLKPNPDGELSGEVIIFLHDGDV